MFGRLLLLFVFLPMVELYLLIMLGARIGPMPTIIYDSWSDLAWPLAHRDLGSRHIINKYIHLP